jgi:hypothetical protein
MANHRATHPKTVEVWTYPQAKSAVPYIASIMRSLRDSWLEARVQQRQAERLANRRGRLDRSGLVAHAEALRTQRKAEEAYAEAAEELTGLGILCDDPVRGTALLPCVHQHVLAWMVFDLFADERLRCWRYHNDPLDAERPIRELMAHAAEHSLIW